MRAVSPLPEARRQRLVLAFKALADPTRLEILRLIGAQAGPTCVCDVVDHFELSQPTISHHLKTLREAGLLATSRRGIWSFYELQPSGARLLAELGSALGEAPADGAA